MSDNSSGSEDEFEKIKEAVDENFLTEDLYSNDKPNNSRIVQRQPPSLKNQNHKPVSVNPFSIKVTPEFQLHVSKHLSRLLDELIDDTEVISKSKILKCSSTKSGVKLLCSSKDYVKFPDSVRTKATLKKFVRKNVDTNIYTERAKEVAVSPEWVLSQEETKHWAPCTKGEIEIVKLGCQKKFSRHQSKENVRTDAK